MSAQRDSTISFIRMISTIMIVLLHILQYMNQYNDRLSYITDWLNLGLVMFFSISAFLYSSRKIENKGKWLFHRYSELVIPAIIVAALTMLVFAIFRKLTADKALIAIASALGLEAFLSNGWLFIQLWFLTYIIVCYITVPYLQRIDFAHIKGVWFWLGIVCTTIFMQGIGSALSMISGLPTLSWGILLRFYLPYALYKRYSIHSEKCLNVMKVLTIVSIVLVAVTCYIRYGMVLSNVLASFAELLFVYTQTLVGTVLFFWIYHCISRCSFDKRILAISDKYSYPVYLTHCLFIGYSTSIIGKFDNWAIGIVAALILTAVASVIVSFISRCIKRIVSIS